MGSLNICAHCVRVGNHTGSYAGAMRTKPSIRDAKLDLAALRAAGHAAQERVNQLPSWQREAIVTISKEAASWNC